jgi:ketosteroid isomerase-like protein
MSAIAQRRACLSFSTACVIRMARLRDSRRETMHRISSATLAVVVLAFAAPAQAVGPAKVLQDWARAHAEGNAASATTLYTEDARVWSLAAPRQWVGSDDFGHYLRVFALGAAPPALHIDSYGLQYLAAGVVVASGHCAVEREQWDGSMAREECRFSLTLVQDSAGAWRIAEQHSSARPR